MNNFRGDLSNISAKTASLERRVGRGGGGGASNHPVSMLQISHAHIQIIMCYLFDSQVVLGVANVHVNAAVL